MADYDTLEIFKTRCDLELEISHYTKELRDITPMSSLSIANVWEGELGLMEHVLVDFPKPRKAHVVNSFLVDIHDISQKYHIIKKNVTPFNIGHSTNKNKATPPVKENKLREDRKENIPYYNVTSKEATAEEWCYKNIDEVSKINIKLSGGNDTINIGDIRCSDSMQSVNKSKVAKLGLDKKNESVDSSNENSKKMRCINECSTSHCYQLDLTDDNEKNKLNMDVKKATKKISAEKTDSVTEVKNVYLLINNGNQVKQFVNSENSIKNENNVSYMNQCNKSLLAEYTVNKTNSVKPKARVFKTKKTDEKINTKHEELSCHTPNDIQLVSLEKISKKKEIVVSGKNLSNQLKHHFVKKVKNKKLTDEDQYKNNVCKKKKDGEKNNNDKTKFISVIEEDYDCQTIRLEKKINYEQIENDEKKMDADKDERLNEKKEIAECEASHQSKTEHSKKKINTDKDEKFNKEGKKAEYKAINENKTEHAKKKRNADKDKMFNKEKEKSEYKAINENKTEHNKKKIRADNDEKCFKKQVWAECEVSYLSNSEYTRLKRNFDNAATLRKKKKPAKCEVIHDKNIDQIQMKIFDDKGKHFIKKKKITQCTVCLQSTTEDFKTKSDADKNEKVNKKKEMIECEVIHLSRTEHIKPTKMKRKFSNDDKFNLKNKATECETSHHSKNKHTKNRRYSSKDEMEDLENHHSQAEHTEPIKKKKKIINDEKLKKKKEIYENESVDSSNENSKKMRCINECSTSHCYQLDLTDDNEKNKLNMDVKKATKKISAEKTDSVTEVKNVYLLINNGNQVKQFVNSENSIKNENNVSYMNQCNKSLLAEYTVNKTNSVKPKARVFKTKKTDEKINTKHEELSCHTPNDIQLVSLEKISKKKEIVVSGKNLSNQLKHHFVKKVKNKKLTDEDQYKNNVCKKKKDGEKNNNDKTKFISVIEEDYDCQTIRLEKKINYEQIENDEKKMDADKDERLNEKKEIAECEASHQSKTEHSKKKINTDKDEKFNKEGKKAEYKAINENKTEHAKKKRNADKDKMFNKEKEKSEYKAINENKTEHNKKKIRADNDEKCFKKQVWAECEVSYLSNSEYTRLKRNFDNAATLRKKKKPAKCEVIHDKNIDQIQMKIFDDKGKHFIKKKKITQCTVCLQSTTEDFKTKSDADKNEKVNKKKEMIECEVIHLSRTEHIKPTKMKRKFSNDDKFNLKNKATECETSHHSKNKHTKNRRYSSKDEMEDLENHHSQAEHTEPIKKKKKIINDEKLKKKKEIYEEDTLKPPVKKRNSDDSDCLMPYKKRKIYDIKSDAGKLDKKSSFRNVFSKAVQDVTINSTNSGSNFTTIPQCNSDKTACLHNISKEGTFHNLVDNNHQTLSTYVADNVEQNETSVINRLNFAKDIHSFIEKIKEYQQFLTTTNKQAKSNIPRERETAIQFIDQFKLHFQEFEAYYVEQLIINKELSKEKRKELRIKFCNFKNKYFQVEKNVTKTKKLEK